ncbi:MAG: OmpA family protein, partial [Thioalkalivibrio sp.]|nr:OmpA family protein [Thioalkalivibrio sp.]
INPEPAPAATAPPVERTVTESLIAAEQVTPVMDAEPIAAAVAPAVPAEFAAFMDLVAAHGEQQNLELLLDRHQLRLEVGNDILFPSGAADLADGGRSLLAELSNALSDDRLKISVEGHTDDVPISTARFPSNWELSSIRAITVARELIALGVPQQQLRVTGYADTHPRATNDSATNRALNRRVSLVLEVAEDPLSQE